MRYTIVLFIIILGILGLVSRTAAYVIPGLAVIVGSLVSKPLYCHFKECCKDRWIPQNFTNLQEDLQQKVFGQHIAIEVVYKAVKGHVLNQNPEKALVLSFHGWTGCGKNHVSKIIANNLYKLGMDSKYTHQIIATHDFPHKKRVPEYQDKLRNFIIEKVKQCSRTLFIFDEVDKVPPGLMDSLRPFLEHHPDVDGVDFRKCIFIFLSNTGAKIINTFVFDHYGNGNERENLTIKDMEPIINNGAFNLEGGLWHSELILHHLIDFFVPFMPLEKIHVKECIRADLKEKHKLVKDINDIVNKVADQMLYSSPDKVFSVTGCKKVSSKVNYIIN